jgi:hypothetical protein
MHIYIYIWKFCYAIYMHRSKQSIAKLLYKKYICMCNFQDVIDDFSILVDDSFLLKQNC